MLITREQIKQDVTKLVDEGFELLLAETSRRQGGTPEDATSTTVGLKPKGTPKAESRTKATSTKTRIGDHPSDNRQLPLQVTYQSWYTRVLPLVKLVLPDRYGEFVELYKIEKRKEIDSVTYTISDYLSGLRITRGIYKEEVVNPLAVFTNKFQQQIFILHSCVGRLDSALSDIRGMAQAELFDDELDAATELSNKGHLRAAGALAGVTLERHLVGVTKNHGINPNVA